MVNLPKLILLTNYKAIIRGVHSHFYKANRSKLVGNKRF